MDLPPPARIRRKGLALWLGMCLLAASTAGAAPSAPRFLPGQPMVVGEQILLMWAPVPGATSYVVYQNGRPLGRVDGPRHMIPLPSEPGEYRYQISGVDARGDEGERSEPGFVKVRRLARPRNGIAYPDPASRTIGLVWDKVEGAVIYNVYRSSGSDPRRLLASVQDQLYKDGDVQPGVEYTYVITAKNLAGLESAPSEAISALWTPPQAPHQRKEPVFRALPTTPVLSVDDVDGTPLDQVSHLAVGPEGRVWVVTPRSRQIHVLDQTGNPVATFGPYDFDKTGVAFLPHKLAFGRDGHLYVTDAINAILACIGPGGTFLWARGILPPPPSADEVWEEFPERMKSLPATPSSVLCLDDEIWVTEQRFQILYRFDYAGNFLGYLCAFTRDGEQVRFPGIGELAALPGNRVLITFPLSHWAGVFDRELVLRQEIGADAKSFVGGFVGIHGAFPLPGSEVLLTDPAVGSLQVFDAASGEYRYHLSGPSPRRDPRYAQRADLPVRKPNMGVRDPTGQYWVYDAAARRLVVLRQSGQLSPPPAP
ncbi:MAG: hypothetical protein Kow0092_35500 [Deferrisomatales bacterium]